jgi:hypothetical protein
VGWAVETLDETVDSEIKALPEDMRAKLARIAKLIEEKVWIVSEIRMLSIWKVVCGRCG